MGRIMRSAAERWKPEAMHFTTVDGHPTALMMFDLPDAPDMPLFAEPFFMELNTDLQLAPVMNSDDLARGLSQLS